MEREIPFCVSISLFTNERTNERRDDDDETKKRSGGLVVAAAMLVSYLLCFEHVFKLRHDERPLFSRKAFVSTPMMLSRVKVKTKRVFDTFEGKNVCV